MCLEVEDVYDGKCGKYESGDAVYERGRTGWNLEE